MKKGKYENVTAKNSVKLLTLMLVLMMVVCGVVGTSMAWLVAQSNDVVNTFTYGDINIDLDETDADDDGDPDENDYKMMPGIDIAKDPKVTVKKGSEANWLFVQLTETDNFDDFLTYEMADGWTQLLDEQNVAVEGVFFRFVPMDPADADVVFSVLKDDKVSVKESVTKEMLNQLDADPNVTNYPKLTVKAYAVQNVGFEAEISAGATEATAEQNNAAALKAWNAANATATP